MKKMITVVITMMAIIVALTGCNAIPRDDDHAVVSITTSDGQAYVFQSVNGTFSNYSGKERAIKYDKIKVNIKTGENVHILFKCDACGNKQEFDIDEAWADLLSCDCPDTINKNGNIKEYVAIEVLYNQKDTPKKAERYS